MADQINRKQLAYCSPAVYSFALQFNSATLCINGSFGNESHCEAQSRLNPPSLSSHAARHDAATCVMSSHYVAVWVWCALLSDSFETLGGGDEKYARLTQPLSSCICIFALLSHQEIEWTKQQLISLPDLAMLGSWLVSFHFLCDILLLEIVYKVYICSNGNLSYKWLHIYPQLTKLSQRLSLLWVILCYNQLSHKWFPV